MNSKIIIGARGSKLASKYAEIASYEIKKISPLNIEHKKITTKGDLVLDKRTSEIGGKGEFVKKIEEKLLEKKIDIAVHSLKDMPTLERNELITCCFLKRNNPNEVMLSKKNTLFKDLKAGSIIGTSSLRREFQIKSMRPDLNFKLIRGNIDTRIKKLYNENYDAIILAQAGLEALSLKNEITQTFDLDEMIPSAGQGIIVLQCRKDDYELIKLLKKINHEETNINAFCEKGVLKILDGDCDTAAGIISTISNNLITINAELYSPDGKKKFLSRHSGPINDVNNIINKVGKELKDGLLNLN